MMRDRATSALVQRCAILRHELAHFTTAISSYLSFEVLDAAGERWRDALAAGGVQSLDRCVLYSLTGS